MERGDHIARVTGKGARALAAALLLATGCAEAPARSPDAVAAERPPVAPFAAPPGATAQICVLRPHEVAPERVFVVHDNGKAVGATRGATYFCYLAGPGLHHVSSKSDEVDRAQVYAQAGERYYLYQEASPTPGHVHAQLEWVDEGAARKLIEGCDERVKVSVPGVEDQSGTMPYVPGKPR